MPIVFDEWCDCIDEQVNGHTLTSLSGRTGDLAAVLASIAVVVSTHYASEEHVAQILDRLGKRKAAEFIRQKLPTSNAIRSGDLGEILATEYIIENTPFAVPIKRLRWKDHRNMAMRGDDIIGLKRDPETGRLSFLKAEAKSRVALQAAVLTEARQALDKDEGLPSPHALSFISERLFETAQHDLADAIDDAQLKQGIIADDIEHLIFALFGSPSPPLAWLSCPGQVQPAVIWGVRAPIVDRAILSGVLVKPIDPQWHKK
jgi:Cap4 SAVED domain